jgi:hypothetical protein
VNQSLALLAVALDLLGQVPPSRRSATASR